MSPHALLTTKTHVTTYDILNMTEGQWVKYVFVILFQAFNPIVIF